MRIGPTFAAEIEAGGLLGLPFAWTRDGVSYGAGLSKADRTRIEAVVAAHDPTRVAPLSLPDISDRQFGRGLWGDGVITYADCEAFVSVGAIPAPLQAIIDRLPDDDTGAPTPRKDATIFIKGAKTYQFAHPLVDVIREAQGWSVEHLRDRWTAWNKL